MSNIKYCEIKSKFEFVLKSFIIKSEKLTLQGENKSLYIFNVYEGNYYLGSAEIKSSTLKSAIVKLDQWLLWNFPIQDYYHNLILDKEEPLMDNNLLDFEDIKEFFCDTDDYSYLYCPECGSKTFRFDSKCRICESQFENEVDKEFLNMREE
ncbi:MAG: hypothetical protein ACFE9N_15945 [Promethearchaeota archaeon]